MDKRFAVAILIFLISTAGLGRGTPLETTLRDGAVLAGLDGKITMQGNRCFFELESAVSDDKGQLRAGTTLELLPSAALEQIIINLDQHSAATYRLWGRITKYHNKNFIFVIYSLPISEAEQSKSSQQEIKLAFNDPNDELAVPQEIMEKLKTKKIIYAEKPKKGLELKADCILADRIGFIVTHSDSQAVFVLDSIGRNVGQTSFGLLPCETLELTQYKQPAEPEQMRFKIAGIVTKYKGQNYLLLERAAKVYNYGNFR